MSLSNLTFKNLMLKLNLKSLKKTKEQIHLAKLLNQTTQLKTIKKTNLSKKLGEQKHSSITNENLLVSYILSITFLRTNTTIQLSNAKGEIIFFRGAGDIGFQGKQKKRRKIALNRLIRLLKLKISFANDAPVAIHLKNVRTHKFFIIKHLESLFFIRVIKSFNKVPYNGCRKRKVRRKKYVRKTIK